MKYLVVGHGRHGKDTVADVMKEFGVDFTSSSEFCAEHVVFPTMLDKYLTWEECFDDRHNHRDHWFNMIKNYGKDDPARLAKEITAQFDIYCGMRNPVEFMAAKHLFDLCIWVERYDEDGNLYPLEPSSSMGIPKQECDIVITNDGTLNQLHQKVANLMCALGHVK